MYHTYDKSRIKAHWLKSTSVSIIIFCSFCKIWLKYTIYEKNWTVLNVAFLLGIQCKINTIICIAHTKVIAPAQNVYKYWVKIESTMLPLHTCFKGQVLKTAG